MSLMSSSCRLEELVTSSLPEFRRVRQLRTAAKASRRMVTHGSSSS